LKTALTLAVTTASTLGTTFSSVCLSTSTFFCKQKGKQS